MLNYKTFLCSASVLATLLFSSFTALSQDLDFSSFERMQESVTSAEEDMTDADKKEFSEAVIRILLSRSPLTKNLEGFPALMVFANQKDDFFTDAGDAFDGITPEVVQAEIAAFTDKNAINSQEVKAAADVANTLLACLQSKVKLSSPHFDGTDGDWFSVDITNNLSWAIRGYHIAYVIRGDNRSVPVKEDNSSSEIPGGIEPNETKTVSVWAGASISDYKSTAIDANLINLFDVEDRRLVNNNINYIGRSPDLSPNVCE